MMENENDDKISHFYGLYVRMLGVRYHTHQNVNEEYYYYYLCLIIDFPNMIRLTPHIYLYVRVQRYTHTYRDTSDELSLFHYFCHSISIFSIIRLALSCIDNVIVISSFSKPKSISCKSIFSQLSQPYIHSSFWAIPLIFLLSLILNVDIHKSGM